MLASDSPAASSTEAAAASPAPAASAKHSEANDISGSGGVAATSAGVEQDVLDKLREFDIEEAAGPLAQHGFKKMRTLQKMDDRFS